MPKTRVMIVEDQRLASSYLELIIGSSGRYEVVHTVDSAAFADTYVLRGGIDLVLMDVLMADGSDGLEAAGRIKKAAPQTKVIVITSIPEPLWLDRARELGVESFWYKDAPEASILDVMDRTMAGKSVYPDAAPVTKVGLASSDELTDREIDILRALVDGLSNAQIGKQLYLSESTVKTHVQHLLDKTGCANRTQLAVSARASGLVVGTSR